MNLRGGLSPLLAFEMSVAGRNLYNRNEVNKMSTSAISSDRSITIARRPRVDVMVERLARRLLRWSEARSDKLQLSHARVALLRENERTRFVGGSSLGR
jgi:hypothetical protein